MYEARDAVTSPVVVAAVIPDTPSPIIVGHLDYRVVVNLHTSSTARSHSPEFRYL